MNVFEDLKDEEWEIIANFCTNNIARIERRGRPRVEARAVTNAVLWMLSTGESWAKLPGRYPSPPTCRRRFEEWQSNGKLDEIIEQLASQGRHFNYKNRAKLFVNKSLAMPSHHSINGKLWVKPEAWRAPPRKIA